MNNPSYDAGRVFEGINSFENKLVAFVDVMGIKKRMLNALKPQDLQMFSVLMHVHANEPYALGKISTVAFSDCMYMIADGQYYKELICLLANFSYSLLVNRHCNITMRADGSFEDKVCWDCLKLRGGLTYGKVLTLDDSAFQKNVSSHFNMVLGPAAIQAYELESKKAFYPRIIVDDAFEEFIANEGITNEECFLIRDDTKDYYYIDFWKYMFKGTEGPSDFLNGCIEFVRDEIEEAKNNSGNEHLMKQLIWYLEYLRRYQF